MKYVWLAYAIVALAACVCDLIAGKYGWAVVMAICMITGVGEAINYRKENR